MLENAKLQEYLNKYLTVYCVVKGFEKKTIKEKRSIYNRLLVFLDGRDFTIETVVAFHAEMLTKWQSRSGRRLVTSYLKAFVNWMVKHEEENIDVAFATRLKNKLICPEQNRRANFTYVEPQIVLTLIDEFTEPQPFIFGVSGDNPRNKKSKLENRLALHCLVVLGLRVTELIHLKGSDLNIDDRTCWIDTKGNKDGRKDLVPLPPDMIDELKLRVGKEKVFDVNVEGLNRIMRKVKKRLGITTRFSVHDLRHIHATYNLRRTGNLELIKKSLRHKSIKTTSDNYAHLNIEDVKKMVSSQSFIRKNLDDRAVIEQIENKIKESGIDDLRGRLKVEWQHLANGGLVLRVEPLMRGGNEHGRDNRIANTPV